MLLKVKFFGHEIGYNTLKPIHSKIAAIVPLEKLPPLKHKQLPPQIDFADFPVSTLKTVH